MKPYYQDEWTTLYCGDCRDVMDEMEANSIDTIVTDAPYGLEFMGKDWDYEVPGVEYWEKALRVCKPGASMLAMGGTRTHHRLMCAIEDAGWKIRDCLMWLYGTGFPKSLDISKAIDKAAGVERKEIGQYIAPDGNPRGVDKGIQGGRFAAGQANYVSEKILTAPTTPAAQLWDGWGTALKPSFEPVVLAMKPREGTFVNNALEHGVAGLWIDGSRIGVEERTYRARGAKNLVDQHAASDRPYVAGLPSRDEPEVTVQGRWPANIILDEEVAGLLDQQTGELKSGSRKAGVYAPAGANCYGDYNGCHRPEVIGNSGGASRFFYTAKSSKSERTMNGQVTNPHPTVKPLSLMQYLCRLTKTPTGGVVLDPFAGSGTTLLAARLEGRKSIGIEKNPEYCLIAAQRLAIQNKELS